MTKHATALRAFTHAGESFAAKQTILNMDTGQFSDWSAEGVDLVREATDAEVAKARGDKPAAEKATPAPRKPGRKPKAPAASPTPAPAPAAASTPEPAVTE